jgi:hypothetical protein
MPPLISRRTFNKLGLLAGTSAWVLPAWSSAALTRVAPVDLTRDERDLFQSFAEALIPTEGTSLRPLSEVPVVDNIAGALASLDEPTLDEVRTGLKLFNYGPFVIGFHFTSFPKLSVEDRQAYIRRWEDGVTIQRGVVDLLKKLTFVGYWQDIEAARAIGYQGPVSIEGGIPYLGNAPMPVEESPA